VGPGRGDAGRLVVMNYAVTFVDIASTRVALLQTVLTTVLTAEHSVLVPILRALLGIFVGRQFFLVMFGHMTMDRFWNSVIRALVIVFLVANATNFNQWVATKMFTNIPQALTSLGVGSYAPTSAGQSSAAQFDSVSAAGDAIAAQIVAKSSIWSVSSLINGGTGYLADGCFQIILCCIFGIWLLGLGLLSITLCLGPPFLCFEFFDRTRGFVDQWIGKLVGFTAFGFATSIVLAMQMQGLTTTLAKINGMAAQNVPAAVAMMMHAVGDGILDLLLMGACPIAFGFGSGAVAALAAPAALAAGRSLMVAGGAAKGVAGAAGAGGKAVANTASRFVR
jgi:type IV secretory pathway VirB6-like protein